MTHPLISSDQAFALWAVLLSAATIGVWAERTRWGAWISGAVVTIGVTFGLSNLRVIPATAPTYDIVWTYLVPLAIPLLLFNANVLKILRETGSMLLAFLLGAIGTILGTVLAYVLLPLGEAGWQLAAIFCATYIGGSVNFAATAEAVGLRSGDLLSAGAAADNLVMMVHFMVLFSLPSIDRLRQLFPSQQSRMVFDIPKPSSLKPWTEGAQVGQNLSLLPICQALAISAIVCAVGFGIANRLNLQTARILVITVLSVGLATGLPKVLGQLRVAETMGTLLMQIFFAVIGASANIAIVLQVGPILFVLATVILATHLFVLLITGYFFKLDLVELTIASNANTGGPTTAAAMAAARHWDKLVTPAILCGTLGYSIATFVGVALGNLLQSVGGVG